MNAQKLVFFLVFIPSSTLLLFSEVKKKNIIHYGVTKIRHTGPRSQSTITNNTKSHDYYPPTSKFKSKQRVLFAGPHKTASSSIEYNLMRWIRDATHPSGLGSTWSWPSPIDAIYGGRKQKCEWEQKVFYWWIQALSGAKNVRCLPSFHGKDEYSRIEILDKYKTEFYNEWMKGRSLAIATEAMDFVTGKKGLLDDIIRQLPWNADFPVKASGSNNDITVVVTYRSPRVKHLESMWHQCCMREGVSFYQYLVDPKSRFHVATSPAFDSLRLVEKFLEKGLNVTLVDMEGVINHGYDISNIMACDILGANCNADKTFIGMEDKQAEILNVKNGHSSSSIHNITTDKLEHINWAILRYDCALVSVIGHPNVTTLYSFGIEKMIEFCDTLDSGERIMTMNALRNKIAAIVQN